MDPFGRTRVRSWGDVTSIELIVGDKAVFSFQIADRSARLREAVRAPWPDGIQLDHLDDLLASKMEALVNRGAPRDFRDVRAVCAGGLASPARLWELWAERRDAARQEKDPRRAALAVRTHLERIDFVARVCGAWDFGILPDLETVEELSKPTWRDAVNACRLLTASSYHLLRRIHGLPQVPYLGPVPAYVREDPSLGYV